jgi:cell division protein ZapD
MAIKNRAAIPGGVSEFDLPGYHYWLNLDPAFRKRDLHAWMHPMMPIREGIAIVLRLLRASGRAEPQVAAKGVYQLMLAGRTAQLVRVRVKRADAVIPEISANKYALNIRFTMPDNDLRPKQSDSDIPFDLTFCNL